MTLSTNIYVLDQVDPEEVFVYCQNMLGRYDDPEHRGSDKQTTETYPEGGWRLKFEVTPDDVVFPDRIGFRGSDLVWVVDPDAWWNRNNIPDQGLPAWLLMDFRRDRPLTYVWDADACDEDCEEEDEPCDRVHSHRRACWLKLDFDTSYSFNDSWGWGCADLHAALISELGLWLDARGVRWEWVNEFTGEVWGGEDRDALLAFGQNGANEWRRRAVVAPEYRPCLAIEDAVIIDE
jgi:hypothetical protein